VTWLKLDDQVTEHPKCVGLSCEAWTLWLHGLTYCSRNLTDGVIPDAILSRLSPCRRPRKAAAELVSTGLWERIENAHLVHDYEKHQRSKAEVTRLKDASIERQKRSRERRQASNGGDSSESVAVMSQRDMSVSHTPCHTPVTAPDTDTDTDTDSGNTLQRDSTTGGPHVTGKARAIVAKVRTEAQRIHGKQHAEQLVADATRRVTAILEDCPDAPDQVVVGYLLGQGNNLRHYRRADHDRSDEQ
jgi:hypothetical protein